MTNWGQLGISVALIAAFSVAMTEFLRKSEYYEAYRWHIIASLTFLGLALWIWGKISKARQNQQAAEVDENNPVDAGVVARGFFFSLFSPGFWGPMLNIFAAIALLITPTGSEPEIAAAPIQPTEVRELFPELKMQGVTQSSRGDSALVNGETLKVGDEIEGARLIKIGYDSATFQWKDRTKTVRLGR